MMDWIHCSIYDICYSEVYLKLSQPERESEIQLLGMMGTASQAMSPLRHMTGLNGES